MGRTIKHLPKTELSADMPLLNGEKRVATGVVQDRNSVIWTIVDENFYAYNKITLQIEHDGKIVDQPVYNKYNKFASAAKKIETCFIQEYCKEIKVIAFMAAGGCVNKFTHVYKNDENPGFDNLNGRNLVYKVRVIINDKVQDSDVVAFADCYNSTNLRAQFCAHGLIDGVLDRALHRNLITQALKNVLPVKNR